LSKLYVNEVYSKTGSVKAIEIDSDGQVKKPNQLMFRAYYDDGEITADGDIAFNGTYENTTGSAFNTSTGKFTVPTAGVWVFSFIGMTDNDSTANHPYVALMKNDVQQVRSYTYKEASQHTQLVIGAHPTVCEEGDVIHLYYAAQGGVDLYGNSASYTQFSGFMLG
jgi:hypothetical protein